MDTHHFRKVSLYKHFSNNFMHAVKVSKEAESVATFQEGYRDKWTTITPCTILWAIIPHREM